MKRIAKLIVLPLIALLASCNEPTLPPRYNLSYNASGVPVLSEANVGEGEHITYLMMSKYGYIKTGSGDVFGEDVPDKYLENCIIWKTDAPSAANPVSLPKASDVFSTVAGATFRGWAQYNSKVVPDYLTNVPEKSGEIVYAIFDGTSGGGGDDPVPGEDFIEGTYYVVGNKDYSTGTSKPGPSWDDSSKAFVAQSFASEDPNIKVQYKASVTFAAGDEWKIRSKEYVNINNYELTTNAFTGNSMSISGENVLVNNAGTYDIYIKVYQSDYVGIAVISQGGDTPILTSVTVYFETASWWAVDGAASAIHYWGQAGVETTWPGNKMTLVGNNIWKYDIPQGVTGFMFVRISDSGVDWGAKTIDLSAESMKDCNMYSIASTSATWGDPGVKGVWTNYKAN